MDKQFNKDLCGGTRNQQHKSHQHRETEEFVGNDRARLEYISKRNESSPEKKNKNQVHQDDLSSEAIMGSTTNSNTKTHKIKKMRYPRSTKPPGVPNNTDQVRHAYKCQANPVTAVSKPQEPEYPEPYQQRQDFAGSSGYWNQGRRNESDKLCAKGRKPHQKSKTNKPHQKASNYTNPPESVQRKQYQTKPESQNHRYNDCKVLKSSTGLGSHHDQRRHRRHLNARMTSEPTEPKHEAEPLLLFVSKGHFSRDDSSSSNLSRANSDSESINDFNSSPHLSQTSDREDLNCLDEWQNNRPNQIAVFWDSTSLNIPFHVTLSECIMELRARIYPGHCECKLTVSQKTTNLDPKYHQELRNLGADLVYGNMIRQHFRNFIDEHKEIYFWIVLASEDVSFLKQAIKLRNDINIYLVVVSSIKIDRSSVDQYISLDSLLVNKGDKCITSKVIDNLNSFGNPNLIDAPLDSQPDLRCFLDTPLEPQKLDQQRLLHAKQNQKSKIIPVPIEKTQEVLPNLPKYQEQDKMINHAETAERERCEIKLELLKQTPGVNRSYWKQYFFKTLKGFHYKLEFNGRIVTMRFKNSDRENATKVSKKLKRDEEKMSFKVSLSIPLPKKEEGTVQSRVHEQLEDLRLKSVDLINKHQAKITIQQQDLENCESQQSNRPASTKQVQTKSVIADKLKELEEQLRMFEKSVTETERELNQLTGLSNEEFDSRNRQLMKFFGCECRWLISALPIYARKEELVNSVEKHQVVVLLAETGSGKSTQVTQYLYQAGFGERGKIVCTQPRKIAAVTLAKYVGEQLGVHPNSVVRAHFGSFKHLREETKIVYSRDYTILNECIENPTLDGISCIIVDEAHERSLFTDILLGILQGILKKRQDLKLIITSATIDPKIFTSYFGTDNDAILNISGRVFPIEIFWNKKTTELNYNSVETSVYKALEIHQNEPRGHILVFLATPNDTLTACQHFKKLIENDHQAVCLQLHGKLNPEDMNKVFEPVGNKRKIIFSTNCAETSLTIQDVVYVVDTGLNKELHFDPVKQMNTLSLAFVTQSSAEQRKGRAGRTVAGKCYRLYSQENYERMEKETKPEILRVNLGQALMKLMAQGVKDPYNFSFVQSPPVESLRKALDELHRLKAVKDGALTLIGEQMNKIPTEPRLSKLIIRGIEAGVAEEAIVTAATAMVSGMIFFRVEENREESDARKLLFCQPEGDFHTFLFVYRIWWNTPENKRAGWCKQNCINAKAMRIIKDNIRDLVTVCQKDLGITVSDNFTLEDNLKKTQILKDLLIESFSSNICIFSGHERLGYFCFPDQEELHVHPSSSLKYLDSQAPKYLLYETQMTTSRPFMMNIIPLTEMDVMEAVAKEILTRNILDQLEKYALPTLYFGRFGKRILSGICGKGSSRKIAIERKIKDHGQENCVVFDLNFKTGLISLTCKTQRQSYAEKLISEAIEEFTSIIGKEQEEFSISTIESNRKAGIGNDRFVASAGLEITDVLVAGEYRRVAVSELDSSVTTETILQKLRTIGKIQNHRNLLSGKQPLLLITYERASLAEMAVQLSKSSSLGFTVKPDGMNSNRTFHENMPPFRVKVEWSRRPVQGYAFVTFKMPSDYEVAIALTYRSDLKIRNVPITVRINKNNKGKGPTLRLTGLPFDTEEKYVVAMFDANVSTKVNIKQVAIIREKKFTTTEEDRIKIEGELRRAFVNYTRSDDLVIRMRPPKDWEIYYNAWLYFHNAREGQVAVLALNKTVLSTFMNGITLLTQPLNLKAEMCSTIICGKRVYDWCQEELGEAIETIRRMENSKNIEVKGTTFANDRMVRIEILTDCYSLTNDLWKLFTNILRGDQLECVNQIMEKLLLENAKRELYRIESKIGCRIIADKRNRRLSIYGAIGKCTLTKTKLNEYLDKVAGYESRTILFDSKPKGLFKHVLKTFGGDLSELLRVVPGLFQAETNVRERSIMFQGPLKAVEKVEETIDELESKFEITDSGLDENMECVICYSAASPEESYRLELCGHLNCRECAFSQLESGVLPLICSKDGCNQKFSLADVREILQEDHELKKKLYQKGVDKFIQAHKGVYSYCPTPDCPEVYRVQKSLETSSINQVNQNRRLWKCSVCRVSVCTQCCIQEHSGISCEFYQGSLKDVDYSVKHWINENPVNRKLCPKCKTGIEKNQGCNHMTCINCKAHMCWLCMKVFLNGLEVYDHQPRCSPVSRPYR